MAKQELNNRHTKAVMAKRDLKDAAVFNHCVLKITDLPVLPSSSGLNGVVDVAGRNNYVLEKYFQCITCSPVA